MIRSYTKKELFRLMWTVPMSELAKRFEFSDDALRRFCKNNEIPLPDVGYWTKVRCGIKNIIPRFDVPNDKNFLNEIDWDFNVKFKQDHFRKLVLENMELILDPSKKIPHIVIPSNFRNRNQVDKEDEFHTFRVPKQLQTRSKDVLTRLYYNLQKLGFEVIISHGTIHLTSRNASIRKEIYIKEKESYSYKSNNYGWNERSAKHLGVLILKVKEIWIRDYIDKPNNTLEEQIPKILAFIMACYQDDLDRKLRHRNEKFQELKKKQEKRRIEKSIAFELKKADDFLIEAKKWENYNVMKSYLDEIRRLKSIGKNVKSEEWVVWAEKYLDEYNVLR